MHIKNWYPNRISSDFLDLRYFVASVTNLIINLSSDWNHKSSKSFWTNWKNYFPKRANVNESWNVNANEFPKSESEYGRHIKPNGKPNPITNGINVIFRSRTFANLNHAQSAAIELIIKHSESTVLIKLEHGLELMSETWK